MATGSAQRCRGPDRSAGGGKEGLGGRPAAYADGSGGERGGDQGEDNAVLEVFLACIAKFVGCCQALKSKCESLTRGVAMLEDKCSNLAATVDGLNTQLDRSAQNEGELQVGKILHMYRVRCNMGALND